MDTILKDFTESELIPLSLVCRSFWQLFDGPKLHFKIKEISYFPQVPILIDFFNETKLKYVIRNNLCSAAAMNGDLELLKWARSKGYYWNINIVSKLAAKHGQLKILMWCRKHCYFSPVNNDIIKCATKKGYLEILKWAYKIEHYIPKRSCDLAVKMGHLEIIKWLSTVNCWRKNMHIIAAKYGQIEILQWLLLNIYRWDEDISKALVIHNNLAMLKWVYEQGCCFHKKIYGDALKYNHQEIVDWLETIGYPHK